MRLEIRLSCQRRWNGRNRGYDTRFVLFDMSSAGYSGAEVGRQSLGVIQISADKYGAHLTVHDRFRVARER